MTDRSLLFHSFSLLAAVSFAGQIFFGSNPAKATEPPRVTEPFVHDNLAIYILEGPSEEGPVPLSLDEALEKGTVKVHETQQVSELEIENTGDEAIFVHAGDIVKGGQQDRVLTVTIVVPPKSGRMPIASYCVERGRWSARGSEEVATFASSKAFMPSLEGKRAMRMAQKAPSPSDAAPADLTATGAIQGIVDPEEMWQRLHDARPNLSARPPRGHAGEERASAHGHNAQGEVWKNVEKMQSALGASLSADVTARASPTSLQLALEDEKLAEARKAYIDALKPGAEAGATAVGLVIAINGEVRSADIYPSNALFRKFWGKHIEAAATEAIANRSETAAKASTPSKADVEAFLADARNGKTHDQPLSDVLKLEISDGDKAEAFASRTKSGALVHINVLKK